MSEWDCDACKRHDHAGCAGSGCHCWCNSGGSYRVSRVIGDDTQRVMSEVFAWELGDLIVEAMTEDGENRPILAAVEIVRN